MIQKLFRNPSSTGHYKLQIDDYLRFFDGFELPNYSQMDPASRLPGIVLERFSVIRPGISDESVRYLEGEKDHKRIIPRIRHALATHSESAALLYLAFGQNGVDRMTAGNSFHFQGCEIQAHHVLPREIKAIASDKHIWDGGVSEPTFPLPVNDLRNYAFVPGNRDLTGKSGPDNPKHNFHQFFHAILNPQTDAPEDESYEFFAPRPVFPFYPPLRRPMYAEEIRKTLVQWLQRPESLDIDAFMLRWGAKLTAFAKCVEPGGYFVPERTFEVAQAQFVYPGAYRSIDPERRQEIAEKSLAARYLPSGATVHGMKLGPFHYPQIEMPVFRRSYANAMEIQPKIMAQKKPIQSEVRPPLGLAVNSTIAPHPRSKGRQYILPMNPGSDVPF